MQVTYNKLNQPSNLITFTDIPNILKVTDTDEGSYCTITITISGSLYNQVNSDKQFQITLLGDTVQNSIYPNNAVNKLFYISFNSTNTAASLARALRNCSNISTNFSISHEQGTMVVLKARRIGNIFEGLTDYYSTNIPTTYITTNISQGSTTSPLYNSLIDVDVYSNGEYITTLEKNFYQGEAAFDMSPLLTTMASEGVTTPYNLVISSLKNGEYSLLGNIDGNYIVPGYMVNQGFKYLYLNDNESKIAMNYYRDNEQYTLYIYKPEITFSYYMGDTLNQTYYRMTYLNSAFQEIGTMETYLGNSPLGDPRLKNATLILRSDWFAKAYYLKVQIGNEELLYNVIKPIKATEYYQRVLWRNSYGGVSFFDFTGKKSETRSLSTDTYEGNLFNYYDDETNTLEKVLYNDVGYRVTLKTHIIDKAGTYIFNDMIQSHNVWTEIGGERYRIVIENFSMEESDINDTFTCQITYRYSQNPTLI